MYFSNIPKISIPSFLPFFSLNHTIYYSDNYVLQRRFLDSLSPDFDIQTFDNWYQVRIEDLREKGATGLLWPYHGNSLSRALDQLYPEYEWQVRLFNILFFHIFSLDYIILKIIIHWDIIHPIHYLLQGVAIPKGSLPILGKYSSTKAILGLVIPSNQHQML